MATFFSYNALVSQRASGYRNTPYALAELVDNAFDADATHVRIILLEKRQEGRKHVSEILVCDNGKGMSSAVLQEALQFGNTTNNDIEEIVAKRKKGKFGYGLPNASLSQSPSIHVYTWQKTGHIYSTYLDLDELKKTQSIEIPKVSKIDLPAYYGSVGAVLSASSGTIVSWRRCDRLSNTKADLIASKGAAVLGRLYRYLLSTGKVVTFVQYEYNASKSQYVQAAQESHITPNDPLFLMSNTTIAPILWQESKRNWNAPKPEFDPASHYKPFAISESKCHPTNERLDDHCYVKHFVWQGRKFRFEIQSSVAMLAIQKPGVSIGANTDVGRFYGTKTKEGSITFVRADREISSGHYGFYAQTDPQHRWWTIEVRFDPDADDLLGVHNNKQGIEFTFTDALDPSEEWDEHRADLLQAKEKLWADLTIWIDEARKAAYGLVRKRHKEWELKHKTSPANGTAAGLPTSTQLTITTQTAVDGVRPALFSDEQRKALFERLKEKYPEIAEKDIARAIENFDLSKARGCVLYSASESEQLWTYTTVFDFLIILINTRHEFYDRALAPLRQAHEHPALASIELFVSSLAWEEHNHFGRGHDKGVIESYRSYVGLHLNRYMKQLDVDEQSFLRVDALEGTDLQGNGE